MAASLTKQGKLMNPHNRVDQIAVLSASVAHLNNARAAGAGAYNEQLSKASVLLCQRIEELAASPLLSSPAAIPAGPSVDAQQADVQLFLWLRERGLDIVGVAHEMLTPFDGLSLRDQAMAAFNDYAEGRKDYLVKQAKAQQATDERKVRTDLEGEAFQRQSKLRGCADEAIDRMIRAELTGATA